jgi:hypothetical protein
MKFRARDGAGDTEVTWLDEDTALKAAGGDTFGGSSPSASARKMVPGHLSGLIRSDRSLPRSLSEATMEIWQSGRMRLFAKQMSN